MNVGCFVKNWTSSVWRLDILAFTFLFLTQRLLKAAPTIQHVTFIQIREVHLAETDRRRHCASRANLTVKRHKGVAGWRLYINPAVHPVTGNGMLGAGSLIRIQKGRIQIPEWAVLLSNSLFLAWKDPNQEIFLHQILYNFQEMKTLCFVLDPQGRYGMLGGSSQIRIQEAKIQIQNGTFTGKEAFFSHSFQWLEIENLHFKATWTASFHLISRIWFNFKPIS